MEDHEICLHPFQFFDLDPKTATLTQLRRKYYEIARHCHPDRGGQSDDMRRVHNTYQWVARQLQAVEEKREQSAVREHAVPVPVSEHVPRWGALVWEVSPLPEATIAEWMGGKEVLEEVRSFVEALLDQQMQAVTDGLQTEIDPQAFRDLAKRYLDRERAAQGDVVPQAADDPAHGVPRSLVLQDGPIETYTQASFLGATFFHDYHEAFQEDDGVHHLFQQMELQPAASIEAELMRMQEERNAFDEECQRREAQVADFSSLE